jgi:Mor family transcriptional regulator
MSKSEYILELEQEIERTLKAVGLNEEISGRIISLLTVNLLKRWRGLTIYFKLSEFSDKPARNNAILSEYNGGNVRFLAQKYGVSQPFIYSLLSDNEGALPVDAHSKATNVSSKQDDNYDWVAHLNVK